MSLRLRKEIQEMLRQEIVLYRPADRQTLFTEQSAFEQIDTREIRPNAVKLRILT